MIKSVWEKICTGKALTIFEWGTFLVLFCCSFLYRFIFFIVLSIKKLRKCGVVIPGTKIISVGNISVGGTGKTVVTQFLVTLLKARRCVIVLRGYKGSHETTGTSLVVSDGSQVMCSPVVSGDEAFMLATSLSTPVVVGSNRARSCLLAKKLFQPDVIILDDAYQNFHVKKNIQILLLDARKPFENGFVLPAGPLREKDITRADCIILTHANEICSASLDFLKQVTLSSFEQSKIFSGKHACDGVYIHNHGCDTLALLQKKPVLVIAGIGSISGFLKTISDAGMIISAVIDLEDHHNYTCKDIEKIEEMVLMYACTTVVTTAKDWVKLSDLVFNRETFSLYVVRIKFEFLSYNEYSSFKEFLDM